MNNPAANELDGVQEENKGLKRKLASIDQDSTESSEEDEEVEESGPNVEEARQKATCARLKIGEYEELTQLANAAYDDFKEKKQKAADALIEAQRNGRLAHQAVTSAFYNMEKNQEDAQHEIDKTNKEIEDEWVDFNARARQTGIPGLPKYPGM